MSAEQDVEATRRLIEDGFGRADLSVVDDVVAPECLEHQPGLKPGPEGIKDAIRTLHGWFSDFDLHMEQVVAHDGLVWTRNRGSGTNSGSVMGHAPTGGHFEIDVFDVCRFENGKIVEHWGVPDQLSMLRQIGVFPPPRVVAVERAR